MDENRKSMRNELQISYLAEQLGDKGEKIELPYQYRKENSIRRGRMTVLFVNKTEDGRLHHLFWDLNLSRIKMKTQQMKGLD